jgi:2-hydroxychromene-2-carboxylate isomerase
MNYAEKTVAKEQPYIFDLVRRGQAASEAGRGLDYVTEVSRVIWSGEVDNWHEGDHLDRAAERAGLDPQAIARTAREEPERLDAAIAANQKALEAAGHWGVPTMVFDGEPFFGQDRVDVLLWRMRQAGLQPRAS